jgi:hypothetical protein
MRGGAILPMIIVNGELIVVEQGVNSGYAVDVVVGADLIATEGISSVLIEFHGRKKL